MRNYLINPVRSILQNHWSELFKTEYHKKQRENKQLPERNLTSASNPNHPPEVKLSALLGENKRCFMTLTRILSCFSLGDLKPTHLNKQKNLRGERESLLFCLISRYWLWTQRYTWSQISRFQGFNHIAFWMLLMTEYPFHRTLF